LWIEPLVAVSIAGVSGLLVAWAAARRWPVDPVATQRANRAAETVKTAVAMWKLEGEPGAMGSRRPDVEAEESLISASIDAVAAIEPEAFWASLGKSAKAKTVWRRLVADIAHGDAEGAAQDVRALHAVADETEASTS